RPARPSRAAGGLGHARPRDGRDGARRPAGPPAALRPGVGGPAPPPDLAARQAAGRAGTAADRNGACPAGLTRLEHRTPLLMRHASGRAWSPAGLDTVPVE